MFITSLLIVVLKITCLITARASPECESWNKIKDTLKSKGIECTVTKSCTGIHCSGDYNNVNLNVKAEIKPCKIPVGIDVIVDVPNTKIRNLTHTLKDGDSYQLPDVGGVSIPLFLDVSLKEESKRNLKVGMKIKAQSSMRVIPLVTDCNIVLAECKKSAKVAIPSVKSQATAVIPAPQIIVTKNCTDCGENEICSNALNGLGHCECKVRFVRGADNNCREVADEVGKRCDVSRLNECDEHEICVQLNPQSQNGTCECLHPYHEDNSTHRCVPDATPPVPTTDPSGNVALTLSIVIPISFLLLCISCAFVLIKQRVCQRIRSRFQHVRRYEVVSIGDDADNDDDEPLVA